MRFASRVPARGPPRSGFGLGLQREFYSIPSDIEVGYWCRDLARWDNNESEMSGGVSVTCLGRMYTIHKDCDDSPLD